MVGLDETGRPNYKLSLEPAYNRHICAPTPVQHLVKLFSEKCYEAVAENPNREIGDIYNSIRAEMTNGMSDEEKIIFLEDIPDRYAIAPRLYTARREFIPREPDDYVSISRII